MQAELGHPLANGVDTRPMRLTQRVLQEIAMLAAPPLPVIPFEQHPPLDLYTKRPIGRREASIGEYR
jgi:hypothetical protein